MRLPPAILDLRLRSLGAGLLLSTGAPASAALRRWIVTEW